MDYRNCDVVESVPGRMSGVPVVKGTRVPVEAIEIGQEIGQTPEELAYDYDLNLDDIRKIFTYRDQQEKTDVPALINRLPRRSCLTTISRATSFDI